MPALPELVRTAAELRARLLSWRSEGGILGFVPTMGALHEGHLSLVRRARAECRCVVVSLFVNPAQFGPGEDFARYPRTLEEDLELCGDGADLVFAPLPAEVYPEPQTVWIEPGPEGEALCGRFRPGHFRGVLTVVAKLFHLVGPDLAYFGEKDWQQAVLVRRMARQLRLPVEVRTCPTVREADGLAMSSRNRYLSPQDRRGALGLIRGLRAAQALAAAGEGGAGRLRDALSAEIMKAPEAKVDYIEIVDPETLAAVAHVGASGALAAAAVRFGRTRLIDNLLLQVGP